MKKTTLCAMLGSTIMFSGTLLAADGGDPIAEEVARRRAQAIKDQPTTPKSEISEKYPLSQYTPISQKILINRETEKFRRKRGKDLNKMFDQIHADEVRQRLEAAKINEEKKQEEGRIRREDLLKQYAEVIQLREEEEIKKQEENRILLETIQSLETQVTKLSEDYRKAQNFKEATSEVLEEMSKELEEKTTELNETKEKLRLIEVEAGRAKLETNTEKEARIHLEEGIQNAVKVGKGTSAPVQQKKKISLVADISGGK